MHLHQAVNLSKLIGTTAEVTIEHLFKMEFIFYSIYSKHVQINVFTCNNYRKSTIFYTVRNCLINCMFLFFFVILPFNASNGSISYLFISAVSGATLNCEIHLWES